MLFCRKNSKSESPLSNDQLEELKTVRPCWSVVQRNPWLLIWSPMGHKGNCTCIAQHVTMYISNTNRLSFQVLRDMVKHGLSFQIRRARKKCCPVRDKLLSSLTGRVTFHSHLPNGQGIKQAIYQLSHLRSKLRFAQDKQNSRFTCSKGMLEFKYFSSPGCILQN